MKKLSNDEAILVDTSVWVNFFNSGTNKTSTYLKRIIPVTRLATCPVIVQEILQGAKSENDFNNIKSFFDGFLKLENNIYDISIEAAILYRRLRSNGITIRKPNDCLIATYAIKNNLSILHEDKDFGFIALHSELKVIRF